MSENRAPLPPAETPGRRGAWNPSTARRRGRETPRASRQLIRLWCCSSCSAAHPTAWVNARTC